MGARTELKRALVLAALIAVLAVGLKQHAKADVGSCSGQTITLPFTDVAGSVFFCTIAEAYFTGLTNGTDATHYSPSSNVTRDQMAAFITRTLDQSLRRNNERAVLDQFWHTQTLGGIGLTEVGGGPQDVKFDGLDLWVANSQELCPGCPDGTISRVRASTGNKLQTWTGAKGADSVLVARGRIYITGNGDPGHLYEIDPTQAPGDVTTITNGLTRPTSMAYDGQFIWVVNDGSLAKIKLNPLSVTPISAAADSILFDGAHMWVATSGSISTGHLRQLDADGNVLVDAPIGPFPSQPVFDGTNIWVPCHDDTVRVIRAVGSSAGTVLATLSGNGIMGPIAIAFDGERVLVANLNGGVSLWKATDFSPIDHISFSANLAGACSDGVNFWITRFDTNELLRF